jgi:RNA polymerase-binding transcription factor DksA
MEQVQTPQARELASTNLSRAAHTLGQINSALRQLEAGQYGMCADRGEEIGQKRFRAIPRAQLCLEYQQLADQAEGRNRAPGDAQFYPNAIAY